MTYYHLVSRLIDLGLSETNAVTLANECCYTATQPNKQKIQVLADQYLHRAEALTTILMEMDIKK